MKNARLTVFIICTIIYIVKGSDTGYQYGGDIGDIVKDAINKALGKNTGSGAMSNCLVGSKSVCPQGDKQYSLNGRYYCCEGGQSPRSFVTTNGQLTECSCAAQGFSGNMANSFFSGNGETTNTCKKGSKSVCPNDDDTYMVNGEYYCCPGGNKPAQWSTTNGQLLHCSCPGDGQQETVMTGNCIRDDWGSKCSNVNTRQKINDVYYCCKNGKAPSSTFDFVNGKAEHICQCGKDTTKTDTNGDSGNAVNGLKGGSKSGKNGDSRDALNDLTDSQGGPHSSTNKNSISTMLVLTSVLWVLAGHSTALIKELFT